MTQQNFTLNLYQLEGDGVQITYILSNIAGQAEFNYQDGDGKSLNIISS